MINNEPAEVKRRWRTRLRLQWRAFSPQQLMDWADAAVGRLQAIPEWRHAQTIFCFIAMRDELPTRPLIEASWRDGKWVAAPVIDDSDPVTMSAFVITDWEQLRPGRFGILAPDRSTARPLSLPEIDLVIVPGLAFDRSCMRLGRGGGYYDRFLARLDAEAVTVGWTASPFLLDESLPRQAHDREVDIIVTDQEVYRCKES